MRKSYKLSQNKKTITKQNKKTRKNIAKLLTTMNMPNNQKSAKSINCSPFVKGNSVNENTCYTTDVLVKIKDEYNKSHKPEEYIPWTNPNEIWRTLKSRLVNCEKEDCWLSEIKDAKLREQLDELIFAPDQPPEWKTNKNEWLSDVDISKVMKQYEKTYPDFKFIGPSPIDFDTRVHYSQIQWSAAKTDDNGAVCVWEELCALNLKKLLDKEITKIGMVFNLDKHDQPGSHWVSLYVDLNPKNPFLFYFDSTGRDSPKEIKVLEKKIIKQGKQNGLVIQKYSNLGTEHQEGNTECGMYSLFFLITMLTGDSGFEQNMTFEEKILLFSKSKIPDKYVELHRDVYFNS